METLLTEINLDSARVESTDMNIDATTCETAGQQEVEKQAVACKKSATALPSSLHGSSSTLFFFTLFFSHPHSWFFSMLSTSGRHEVVSH